jgi:hypothetical protein
MARRRGTAWRWRSMRKPSTVRSKRRRAAQLTSIAAWPTTGAPNGSHGATCSRWWCHDRAVLPRAAEGSRGRCSPGVPPQRTEGGATAAAVSRMTERAAVDDPRYG